MKTTPLRPILAAALVMAATPVAAQVTILDERTLPVIVTAPDRPLQLAGQMLARDLTAVGGRAPGVGADLSACRRLCIVIAGSDDALVRAVAAETGHRAADLHGEAERYERVLLRSRSNPDRQFLLIAGSDTLGAVWGVVDLTREIGVSAWEWWADVTPRRRSAVTIDGAARTPAAPSVRYRGIFLNDEDWGLQPWAAKTYEPETGDIGPKTYARIFELLWRLKANVIWPAMHDSTKPFYQIAGNAQAARDHGIVVGTSHAEPMMRNNVREWDDRTRGDFNFFTNRDAMTRYWRERVEAVKDQPTIFSVGLRGKHDSAMEGAKTPAEALAATGEAIGIQRGLLAAAQGKPASAIPQALTLYKEVLDIYAAGLKVPDDITLIWPEDNYGYISQLSTPAERRRSGGTGIYYHISYWGRPHDYLWLATTHPGLIREQLDRAWQTGSRRIWMVNVGDIKPGEYLTQYFLDLAFDHRLFATTPRDHLRTWAAAQFGAERAAAVADVMTGYYDLAWERRPEFMGFNQTEPTRPVAIGEYVRTGGDEAVARIDRYAALVAQAEALAAAMPADRQDAFFQLVLYPVRGAASLNERMLRLDLAALRTRQGRASADAEVTRARAAHARIVADTAHYNAQNGGKWRGMMDMAPRRLPVFAEPLWPAVAVPPRDGCAVDAGDLGFVTGRPSRRRLTVYGSGVAKDWSLSDQQGITPATTAGRLDADNGFEQQIMVDYDGKAAVRGGTVDCGGKEIAVAARMISAPVDGTRPAIDRIVSIAATDATGAQWEAVPGPGSRGSVLRSRLDLRSTDEGGAPLTYRFRTGDERDAHLRLVALPVHPLTSANRLRISVQIDDAAPQVLDFETHGRSEEWKRNVLSNTAIRTLALPVLAAGEHRIRIRALDPGFLLDRIDVRLDGAPDLYGAPKDR